MTVTNANSSVTHTGNGATTLWPYAFIVQQSEDMEVGIFTIASSVYTVLAANEYIVTGLDNPAGGDVQYPLVGPPLSADYRIVLSRKMEFTQDTDLTNQTPYYPEVLEGQLDRIVMMLQQLKADITRAVLVTEGSNLDPNVFIAQLFAAVDEAAGYASAAAASQAAATDKAQEAADSAALAATFIPAEYDTRAVTDAKMAALGADLEMNIFFAGSF